MPDIYKKQIVEEEEDSVLISDGVLPVKDTADPPEEATEAAEVPQGYAIYSPEELEEALAQRVEQLREQLWEEACQKASEQKGGEIGRCIRQIQDTLHELEDRQRRFMEGYRDNLASLAADIAEKLILHKIEEDDLYLKELVMKTVSSVKKSEWITVEISNQLAGLAEQLRKEYQSGEHGNVEVAARYHPIDTCLMETDEGVVDASISEQIRNLKHALDEMEV